VSISFTTVLAVGSFLLSIYTLWATQLRRGRLKMTQPALVCLRRELPANTPKIFMRTLLFATAVKGRVVENMFLRVQQPMGTYVFDFWGYGESEKLTLGSGLFVGQTGVAYNHHFNPRLGSVDFLFAAGEYRIEVFATAVGEKRAEKLMELSFTVGGEQAAELLQIMDRELWLLWNADMRSYDGHIERRPRRPNRPQEITR
jgi:hypothetical protein